MNPDPIPPSPPNIIVDLLSMTIRFGQQRESISDTQKRLARFLVDREPDTVIPEGEFKTTLWPYGANAKSDTFRMAIGRFLTKVSLIGAPPVLVRERKVGWRRTSVPIAIINPEPEPVAIPKRELSPEEKMLIEVARYSRLTPAVAIRNVATWQRCKQMAEEGKRWAVDQREIDMLAIMARLREHEFTKEPHGRPGDDELGDLSKPDTLLRVVSLLDWVYDECRIDAGHTTGKRSHYLPESHQVVMSYDTCMTLMYEILLPVATGELGVAGDEADEEDGEDEKEHDWSEETPGEKAKREAWDAYRAVQSDYLHNAEGPYAPRYLTMLYEAIEERLPAIDGSIPFGKAIIRYGPE